MEPLTLNQHIHFIVAFINLIICMGIVWFCIGRLISRASKVFISVRIKYLLLLTGAVASGLQPILWSSLPNVGSLIFSLSILIYLFINKENRGI